MDSIPSAKQFADSFDAHRREQKKVDHLNKLQTAVNGFVDAITALLVTSIRNTPQERGKAELSVRPSDLGVYEGIHGTIILYGHHDRGTPFTHRKPLEIPKSAFLLLQERFFAAGWYLIEESDPDVNHDMVRFVLYSKRPTARHRYFNKGLLWHGHDMFDLDVPAQPSPEPEPSLNPAAEPFQPPSDLDMGDDKTDLSELVFSNDGSEPDAEPEQPVASGTQLPPDSAQDQPSESWA